jgi:hypothetical protein
MEMAKACKSRNFSIVWLRLVSKVQNEFDDVYAYIWWHKNMVFQVNKVR